MIVTNTNERQLLKYEYIIFNKKTSAATNFN